MTPDDDAGMILVGVLAMVALAASVVTLMLASETAALDRARRFGEAARAAAIARGGEASVVAAWTRDPVPGGEGWRRAVQPRTPIAGGSFTLAVDDAQQRINVNAAGEATLVAVAAAQGLPVDTAARITGFIRRNGPLRDLSDLDRAGLTPATIDRLRPLLTALPGIAPVNLNTAPEAVLGVMLHDPVQARGLVARRSTAGRLTIDELALAGVSLPDAGLSSDHVLATTTVTVGGTTRRLVSLIERRSVDGHTAIAVIDRRDQRAR